MPKYSVQIERTWTHYTVVDAPNEDAAREFAECVDHDLLDTDHMIEENIQIKDAGDSDSKFTVNEDGEEIK